MEEVITIETEEPEECQFLTTTGVPIEREENMPVDHIRRVISPIMLVKRPKTGASSLCFGKIGVKPLNSIGCLSHCRTKGYLKHFRLCPDGNQVLQLKSVCCWMRFTKTQLQLNDTEMIKLTLDLIERSAAMSCKIDMEYLRPNVDTELKTLLSSSAVSQ
ncbi:unnamed protein product [Oikopleura dioica]|uniref:Uncharacterized protein n=1 Tax=Oikopleura dioica TaxID=34765 RepID=E4XIQ4_OIKDI|nr:unnamed protein product [Oikopleura dioica]